MALERHLRRRDDFELCLVNTENYFVFQPMLPEVAGASISPRHVVNPLRLLCRDVQVFRGEVEAIVEEVDCTPEQLEIKEDDKDQVTGEAHFIDDLGADSLDLVELILAFEEEFESIIEVLKQESTVR